MEMADIRSLLPHAGPMVLLDRLVAADEESVTAEVMIRPDSLFCRADGVGAWVGIEYMAQAIGAYAGYRARLRGEPIRLGFILGTRRYQCNWPMFPVGSVLSIVATRVLEGENGLSSFDCEIVDIGRGPVATATLTVFQPPDVEEFLARSSS